MVSVIIGLLYLMVLQGFSTPQPVFRFLVPAVLLFALLVSFYNYLYLRSLQKYDIWTVLRPFLLLLSGFGVFLLMPSAGLRGLFLVVTTAIVAFFEYSLGSFSENLLVNEILVIALGFFLSFCAFSQYFPDIPQFSLQPLYVIGVFVFTFLLSRSFYEIIPHSPQFKLVNSLAVSLFCTEAFWALTFLPFHYSIAAVLLFNLFYLCLILNYYYLFQTLNFKKIQFHLALALFSSMIVLLATPWKTIN